MIEITPEAAELLNYLHRGGAHCYYWLGDTKQTIWFPAGQPPKLPTNRNVYFGIHPASSKGTASERSKVETVSAINCLFAEFDAKDFEDNKAAALDHIQALQLLPSVVVDSGGGYHCYWLLVEPVHLTNKDAREVIKRLQAEWVIYTGGDPGAKDLARVLRIPDTINTKYKPPRPVSIVWADYDMPYELGEFDAILAAAAKNNPPKPTKSNEIERPKAFRGDPAEYWLRRALEQAAEGSRNRIGFWLACQLRDSGLSEAAARAVQYPENVLAGKRPYTRREWEITVMSAYTHPARTPAQGGGRYSTIAETAAPADISVMGMPITDTRPTIQPTTPDLASIAKAERENEAGDADLFAQMHAGLICFDHAAHLWHVWRGHYWEPDKTNEIYTWLTKRLAAAYLRGAANALEIDNKDLAGKLSKRASLLQTKKRADNVIFLAAGHADLALRGDEWDANPWLLGVENGVIDLKTGDFRPGQPSDYIRAHAPTSWLGIDTPAPRWEKFITEIFDNNQELIDFTQRLLGYGITGLTREHVLPILYGPDGRNGKSTLLETLGAVLGADLATSSQADAIMDNGGHGDGPRPFVYALRGKRLVWASESNEGRRINSGLVKQLTGGDRLNVRTLHSKPVEFEPSHLLLLITNHRPHIPADDQAIWDRVFLLPFTLRFVDDPTRPNERKGDNALKETLRAEAPGILAWLVRGCLAWQRQGLRPPAIVRAATEEYRAEEDTLAQFIADCCVLDPKAKARGGELYEAYVAWEKDNGGKPMSKNAFGQRLKKRFELLPPKNIVTYGGIGLRTLEA